jgi:hypothetical protein
VAQAIEFLLCKYEALSSNPSPTPPKKKGGGKRKEQLRKSNIHEK